MEQRHTGKYQALYTWLSHQERDSVRLTFAEVESILGFSLPPSSRNHLAHWYSYGGSAVGRAIRDAGWRAHDVNLTAETVKQLRGARSTSLAETLESRNVQPIIVEILLGLSQNRPVEVCNDDTPLLPLSAAHDAYAAVYVGSQHLSIALDPETARRVQDSEDFKLENKTATTSYVHITAEQLADPAIAQSASRLLNTAFDRAEHGPRWTRGLPDRSLSRGELCLNCFQEKSLTGTCACD